MFLCYAPKRPPVLHIADPGQQQQKRRWKKFCCPIFFAATNIKKSNNYFIFEQTKNFLKPIYKEL